MSHSLRPLVFLLPLALMACREPKVAVYDIPKETDPPSAQFSATHDSGMAAGNAAFAQADGGGLEWTVPTHWQSQTPTAMRKATYTVAGASGANAELSVTAFPGDVGGELANVNRWRRQLQLAPWGEAELASSITRRTISGLAVTFVDLTTESVNAPQRLLGAIVPVDDATWFFKFTGPPALLEKKNLPFYLSSKASSTPEP